MRQTKFTLVYTTGSNKMTLGVLCVVQGKYIFVLNNNISLDFWKKFGIIPVDEKTRKTESDDLFPYINNRLPIHLRNADDGHKVEYINKSGLRVPSDNFLFLPA